MVPRRRLRRGRSHRRVGWMPEARARRRIDASRLVVAPGFIDMMGQSEYDLLVDSRAASKITQGITTEITGEGSSIAPRPHARGRARPYEYYGYTPTFTTLAGYFEELERRHGGDLGTFVGAGGGATWSSARRTARRRPPSSTMEAAVAQARRAGPRPLERPHLAPCRSPRPRSSSPSRDAADGGSYITHQRFGSRARPHRRRSTTSRRRSRRAWGRMPHCGARSTGAGRRAERRRAPEGPARTASTRRPYLPWVRVDDVERGPPARARSASRAVARADSATANGRGPRGRGKRRPGTASTGLR